MKLPSDSFGFDISGIGTKFSSSALDILSEQEDRLRRMLEPNPAIATMLERETQMKSAFESPAALSAIVEHQKHLQSVMPPTLIEAITVQENHIAYRGLAFSRAVAASINRPQLDMFTQSAATAIASFNNHAFDLATAMGRALETCIPKYDVMTANLSQALEVSLPQLNAIGEMTLKLANSIPKIDFAVSSLVEQAASALGSISLSLQSSMIALADSLSILRIPNFDQFARSLKYINDFEEKNEVLKSFGWYLISELPEAIVEAIYERHHEITQEEVDTLIIEHFRRNRCSALKEIVNSWVDLPYFELRKEVFHQAQVCHSRRTFNASVTLVSIHFEGVITDFVRERIGEPTYRAEKALKRITDLSMDMPMNSMPFTDWIICSFILECIDAIFTTNFSPADPDSCPNTSRHKIAHGHATSKETEANSLRRFLFMNELYKLFYCLESKSQMAS